MLLRRVRGILVAGLLWAIAWAFAAPWMLVGWGLLNGFPLGELLSLLPVATVMYGVYGFVCGVLFSSILLLAERRRSFAELATRRVVVWGILGSTVLQLLGLLVESISGLPSFRSVVLSLQATAVAGMLGGVLAWGQLRIARLGQGSSEEPAGLLDG